MIITEGQRGPRASLTTPWRDELVSQMLENSVVELELNQAKGWRGNTVEFLQLLPQLQALEILDLNISSISDVHHLHGLRDLKIITYCKTPIEFDAFPNLETCTLEWRPGSESLFRRTTLKSLSLNAYPDRDSLVLAGLSRLVTITLSNAATERLDGLRGLLTLNALRLLNLKKLRSLAGIESLVNLQSLELNTCRGVNSIDELGSLINLEELSINNCGNIKTLGPIRGLSKLTKVLFYESTNIEDGDLNPLIEGKHLSRISFQDRRHYTHKRADFGKAYSG